MNDKSAPKECAIWANSDGWMESRPARGESRSKLNDFMANSTIHGLNQLNVSKSYIRRAIWLFLFLGCVSFLCYGIFVDLKKYFKYGIVMSTLIQPNSYLPFPAVTLCSTSVVKKSRLKGHDMKDLMDYVGSIYNGEEPMNISGSSPFDFKKALNETGFDIQDLLRDCRWQSKPCGAENFTSLIDFQVGKCYTFNSRKDNQLTTNDGGSESDLTLLLDANPEETYGIMGESVGFRIQVHEPGEVPTIVKRGKILSTGLRYKVAITRHKTILQESPYPSHCSKDPAAVSGACQAQCIQDAIYKSCNCSMTETIRQRLCTLRESSCYTTIYGKTLDCSCPSPCEFILYETDISSSYYPAPHLWPSFFKILNVTSANESDFKENFRKRYTKLSISYRSLYTTIWEELPAFGLESLCADIGGTMGLFVGCSFLSLCEIIDLLVSLVRLRVCRARARRVQRSLDDKEPVHVQQT